MCGYARSGRKSAGDATSPLAMLSPRAVKRVPFSLNVGVTVTWNTHDAARLAESRAVQMTSETPTGNAVPDGIVQFVVTGCAPPVTRGAVNDTTGSAAPGASTLMSAGQAIPGASTT